MTIQKRLQQVQQQIAEACRRAGRSPEEITIVAVTKTVGMDKTKEVLAAGVKHLGENRSEGLLPKHKEIGTDAIWHFIGSLQTRKVKEVVDKLDYLHSLDRLSLAQEIHKRAEHTVRCFVQVKTSAEESKQGLPPEEAAAFVKELAAYPKIEVIGLMTMAPYTENEDTIRACFRTLRRVQEDVQALQLPHAPCLELSMGMSNDFVIAVEEGATYVRLGTVLVGTEQEGEA
ncbi:YggS family pyridoxal phosphate-dependent enzyme [Ectobacillus ponti]|uniref:Pyridoxal phosphate homeostasis protein n=1 Tax=Ectobacillus ponti TaxID=2961894 RepID=A0AA41X7G7_9BACI|nr:YggS family pyridoxal phosphate-dependent enzyme [Ectobacillus ponti]